eukprot:3923871-Heterocapsa_arctica.AAC.1
MSCFETEGWARASTERAATRSGSALARSVWPTLPSGSLSRSRTSCSSAGASPTRRRVRTAHQPRED